MMKNLLFLFGFLLIMGCNDTVITKPKNLIDENKMIDIYYDLSLLEAVRSQIPQEQQHYKGLPNKYIYKKYAIDSLQFVKNNLYYASDVVNYKMMYEKVKERLIKNQEKLAPKLEKKEDLKILEGLE